MASAALRHPIRVRALEAMNLRYEVSATSFLANGYGKGLEPLRGRTHEQQVAEVGYHLRELEKANCIYPSRKVKRRGVWEKFYRANAVAYFSDEEWAELDLHERRKISRVVAQGFIVQIEGAMLAETFDSKTDRWLLYEPLLLDEAGWKKLTEAIARLHAEVKEIKGESGERVKHQADDLLSIPATFGVVAFESPAWPGPELPTDPDDPE